MSGFFVTGTDTEIGKTIVSSLIIRQLVRSGYKVVGMKPIASGFDLVDGCYRNNDVESLKSASNVDVDDQFINRYRFKPAIAPHIAANHEDQTIFLENIKDDYTQCAQLVDVVIVEGVGGWQVPLNDHQTVADLAQLLSLPVILVVGIRLGCINHALLTVQAIRDKGVTLAGWVANCCAPESECIEDNILSLQSRIEEPMLGVVPYGQFASLSENEVVIDLPLSH